MTQEQASPAAAPQDKQAAVTAAVDAKADELLAMPELHHVVHDLVHGLGIGQLVMRFEERLRRGIPADAAHLPDTPAVRKAGDSLEHPQAGTQRERPQEP